MEMKTFSLMQWSLFIFNVRYIIETDKSIQAQLLHGSVEG